MKKELTKEPMILTLSKIYLWGAMALYWLTVLLTDNPDVAGAVGLTAKYSIFLAFAYGKVQWKMVTLIMIFVTFAWSLMIMNNWFYVVDFLFLGMFTWYILKYR